ncbi:MAG: MarR family winged helix-turn-helix transcriptional regulator [Alphaproteobacteria bacterium]|nr:MarR family winged helix-turn-helix transcriptional regulator [Alphaproteobacteria bacterium]MDX5416644.1 MarR family winged helix-turn-helix transcriptional regulator [Alphaproteobacteria bacterium]MDX5494016.1 MarR family winged helix-turn-helix transcriptional regulator [Alphaproteobacteria bacterium]
MPGTASSTELLEAEVRENCAALRTRMAARKLTRHYDRALRPAGLKITQFTLLVTVAEGKVKSLTALADLLALERSSLVRNVKLLEDEGLIESAPSGDGRALGLRLTKAGRKKLTQALPLWREAQGEVETSLGASWPGVKKSLHQLIAKV